MSTRELSGEPGQAPLGVGIVWGGRGCSGWLRTRSRACPPCGMDSMLLGRLGGVVDAQRQRPGVPTMRRRQCCGTAIEVHPGPTINASLAAEWYRTAGYA